MQASVQVCRVLSGCVTCISQDLRRVLSEVALGLNSCPPDAALQAPFIIEQVAG